LRTSVIHLLIRFLLFLSWVQIIGKALHLYCSFGVFCFSLPLNNNLLMVNLKWRYFLILWKNWKLMDFWNTRRASLTLFLVFFNVIHELFIMSSTFHCCCLFLYSNKSLVLTGDYIRVEESNFHSLVSLTSSKVLCGKNNHSCI